MSPLEQRALLLRQLAALRQRGTPHHQALALAAEGLPVGELRAAVRRALRTLEQGESPGASSDPLEDLLARGDCGVVEIEHLALGVEARLWAATATRTARLYLGIAVGVPLVLAALVGWLPVVWSDMLNMNTLLPGLVAILGAMRWLGLPLLVAALVALRRFEPQVAPGHTQALRAAALLADGETRQLGAVQRRYLQLRREQVGEPQALRELAWELVRESRRSQIVFQHLAPLLGIFLLLPVLAVMVAVMLVPFMVLTSSIGAV